MKLRQISLRPSPKEHVGLALLLDHLDLQLRVDVTSICGDGIPASIGNSSTTPLP